MTYVSFFSEMAELGHSTRKRRDAATVEANQEHRGVVLPFRVSRAFPATEGHYKPRQVSDFEVSQLPIAPQPNNCGQCGLSQMKRSNRPA